MFHEDRIEDLEADLAAAYKEIHLLKAIWEAAQTFRETTEQWFGETRGKQFSELVKALDAYDAANS